MKKLIAICLAVVLSAGLLLTGCRNNTSNWADDPYVNDFENYYPTYATQAPTYPAQTYPTQIGYEQEILAAIEESIEYMEEGKFTKAEAVLDTAEQLYGADYRIEEQRMAVKVAKVLYDVAEYMEDDEYANAIAAMENAEAVVKADASIVQMLNYVRLAYKEDVLDKAAQAFSRYGYEKAIQILNESLPYLPGDTQIAQTIAMYEEYIPINIGKIDYFSGNDFIVENNVMDNLGEEHDNVVYPRIVYNASTTNVYRINKQYSRLTGLWFQFYEYRTEVKYGSNANPYSSEIAIYGDGRLLYSGEMKAGEDPKMIDVNISGVTELTIYYFGGGSKGSYSGVADFNIQK